MNRLIIITMALRPEGIAAVAQSVAQAPRPWPTEHRVIWHHGAPDWGRVALPQRITAALTECPADAWVVFVDDDNLLHPELPQRLAEIAGPDTVCVVFGQEHSTRGYLPASVPRAGFVDGGQVAVRAGAAAAIGWKPGHQGDGEFLEALYAAHRDHFIFVDEPLTWHNAQRWQGHTSPGGAALTGAADNAKQ